MEEWQKVKADQLAKYYRKPSQKAADSDTGATGTNIARMTGLPSQGDNIPKAALSWGKPPKRTGPKFPLPTTKPNPKS